MQPGIPAEQLYEYALKIARIVDYGTSAQALFAGEASPPAQGARVDVYFEGRVTGRLTGTVSGVDYLCIRADGRIQLDIHAEIATDDGKRVALAADGVAIPTGSSLFELRENVSLTTSHPEYAWLNPLQIWATGTVDVSTGDIRIKGFAGRSEFVAA